MMQFFVVSVVVAAAASDADGIDEYNDDHNHHT